MVRARRDIQNAGGSRDAIVSRSVRMYNLELPKGKDNYNYEKPINPNPNPSPNPNPIPVFRERIKDSRGQWKEVPIDIVVFAGALLFSILIEQSFGRKIEKNQGCFLITKPNDDVIIESLIILILLP